MVIDLVLVAVAVAGIAWFFGWHGGQRDVEDYVPKAPEGGLLGRGSGRSWANVMFWGAARPQIEWEDIEEGEEDAEETMNGEG